MSCPHCLSMSASKRKHRTSLGYRTFYCGACDRRFNERSGTPFNDLQFPTDIVLLVLSELRAQGLFDARSKVQLTSICIRAIGIYCFCDGEYRGFSGMSAEF